MAEPRKTLLIVPLTDASPAAMRAAMETATANGADAVEVRLDYLVDTSDAALHCLLDHPPCPLLITCRSAAEGGKSSASDAERIDLLRRAAELGGQWVDMELASLPQALPVLDKMLSSSSGSRGPNKGLIVSAHDFERRPPGLPGILAQMEASASTVNKVAFAAAGPEDALAALDFLRVSRKPAMALAMGESGLASRILAKKLDAFGTFAALQPGAQSAPGQPTLDELRGLYRWDDIGPHTQVFGVVGCPVGHSMSPAIHNAAFAADGIDAVYVPLRVEPGRDNFNRFVDAILERPWAHFRGLSVTIPHKENALARVGVENVDELSAAIGAINTIRFTGNASAPMEGFNTDYAGALDALTAAMGIAREDLSGRDVAVIGAGGAARAIVAALAHWGANIRIYNRTIGRAEELVRDFAKPGSGIFAAGVDELPRSVADIYINCTPMGMHPHVDECPLPETFRLPTRAVVFDTIYNPIETRLLKMAQDAGCRTVSGLEMFVNQAAAQYELWLERPAPREVMRRVVVERLSNR